MMETGLKDKVVLITGANHGIGAATARAFAARGTRVCITYYRGQTRLSEEALAAAVEKGEGGPELYAAQAQQSGADVAAQIEAQGGTAVSLEMDLAPAVNVPCLFDACEEALGPVDVMGLKDETTTTTRK